MLATEVLRKNTLMKILSSQMTIGTEKIIRICLKKLKDIPVDAFEIAVRTNNIIIVREMLLISPDICVSEQLMYEIAMLNYYEMLKLLVYWCNKNTLLSVYSRLPDTEYLYPIKNILYTHIPVKDFENIVENL